MTRTEIEEYIQSQTDEEVLLADGFDDAFIGLGRIAGTVIACYDREKCIQELMQDVNREEAEEYFEFNVQGAYVGPNTPCFIETVEGA